MEDSFTPRLPLKEMVGREGQPWRDRSPSETSNSKVPNTTQRVEGEGDPGGHEESRGDWRGQNLEESVRLQRSPESKPHTR